MKKFFSVVLVSAMVVLTAFTGCSENDTSNGSSQTTSKSSDVQSSAVANKADFDSEEVEKNIKITPYVYDDVSTHYFVAVLKNNSNQACTLTIHLELIDKDDDVIDTETETINAFAPGTEVAVKFNHDKDDEEFARYEYTLLPKELTDYQCVTQDLDCKVSTDTDKATISVTNTGNLVAKYVQYTALFFQGDELVYADNDYVVDSDNEIKAGQTEKAESSCNKKFDSVKVYLNGSAY